MTEGGRINAEGSKLKMYGSLKTETGTEKSLTDITNVKHESTEFAHYVTQNLSKTRLMCW